MLKQEEGRKFSNKIKEEEGGKSIMDIEITSYLLSGYYPLVQTLDSLLSLQ